MRCQQDSPEGSRPHTYTPIKTFNQPSVGDKSSHNISGLSSLLENIKSVMNYQQMDMPQPFTSSDPHQHAASPTTTQQQEPPQQPAQRPSSYQSPSSSNSRLDKLTYLQKVDLFAGSL